MIKRVSYILVFMFSMLGFAQDYVKHTVAKGETIVQIAQKYKVTPYDIYKLNPDAQNGIKEKTTLLIPKQITKIISKETTQEEQIHTVLPKETLYGISKKYAVTVDDIQKNNPILLEKGIQPGQKLVIKKGINSNTIVAENTLKNEVHINTNFITHEVLAKETKYSISKKYNISIEELEKLNPEIKDSFKIGTILKIKSNAISNVTEEVSIQKNETINTITTNDRLVDYIVSKKETLYSLSKKLGISEEKLKTLNPQLIDGLKDGMVLKIPSNLTVNEEVKNNQNNFVKTISTSNKKELVLLLPFNIAKFENDSLTSTQNKLKKDKFLNMTLDFYSGALMAIDSAKTLGINVDVKIFDSNETKTTSNAIDVINQNAPNAHAVIGPFYQNNVVKLAEELQSKNIPVISPLSKDYDVSYSNLIQSQPTILSQKNAMFNYMKSKNGNIIAIIDPKKKSVYDYMQEYQNETKIVGYSDKGGFVGDSIKKLLVSDKINYIVLESEREGTVFTTTSVMLGAIKNYQVQLVVLEPNATLDYDDIMLQRSVKLGLTYPSTNKDNTSIEASRFEMNYKKKNKVLPNNFAMRGFDVTFDTLLRLAQDKSFVETMESASEQIENKFDYIKSVSGGFVNNGIYILQYNNDLTVKQVE